MFMTNINTIVEAAFVRYIINDELDEIKEAFESFASHLINFIHEPVHWVEKHHCLVRLNAIFHVHTLKVKSDISHTYLSLALSLIKTMKELLIETQKASADTIRSFRSGFSTGDDTEIRWTGGNGNLYELLNALQIRKCFNNGNIETNVLVPYIASVFNVDINVDGCYESKRTMKQRKGKGDRKYNRRNMLDSRSYFCDDLSDCLNDNLVAQEKSDGRAARKSTVV